MTSIRLRLTPYMPETYPTDDTPSFYPVVGTGSSIGRTAYTRRAA